MILGHFRKQKYIFLLMWAPALLETQNALLETQLSFVSITHLNSVDILLKWKVTDVSTSRMQYVQKKFLVKIWKDSCVGEENDCMRRLFTFIYKFWSKDLPTSYEYLWFSSCYTNLCKKLPSIQYKESLLLEIPWNSNQSFTCIPSYGIFKLNKFLYVANMISYGANVLTLSL